MTAARPIQPRLTRMEQAITALVLLITFRISLLPSVVCRVSSDSAFWVIFVAMLLDAAALLVGLHLASQGGLRRMHLPGWLRHVGCILIACFCVQKLTLYLYEVATYCQGALFDMARGWPIALSVLVASVLLSTRGFSGIARTGLVCAVASCVLMVLTLFFVSNNGYPYNLFVLLRPRGVLSGTWRILLWCGDGVVLAMADTSEPAPSRPRRMLWPALAILLGVVLVVAFYLVYVYTYGSAGQYVRFAFVRMLMSGNPSELGAVDWPVILMWLMAAPQVLALMLYSGAQGIRQVVGDPRHTGWWQPTLLAALAFGCYFALTRREDSLDRITHSHALSAIVVVCSYALLAILLVVSAHCRRHPRRGTL